MSIKKQTKNLFRIDLNLKYLVYTDKMNYTENDVLNWIKNDFHSGELDEENNLTINKVESSHQIQDFLDQDIDYSVYYTDDEDDDTSISTLVETLGLDADILVAKLRKLGYVITKPKKK
jgi:hypothetical protein